MLIVPRPRGSRASLEGNTVSDSPGGGLLVRGAARPLLRRNTLERNARANVAVLDSARPDVEGNVIQVTPPPPRVPASTIPPPAASAPAPALLRARARAVSSVGVACRRAREGTAGPPAPALLDCAPACRRAPAPLLLAGAARSPNTSFASRTAARARRAPAVALAALIRGARRRAGRTGTGVGWW